MKNILSEESAKKRQDFKDKFNSLVNTYVETYKGGQPIMSWSIEKAKPEIHRDFFNHLPQNVQDKIIMLIKEITL